MNVINKRGKRHKTKKSGQLITHFRTKIKTLYIQLQLRDTKYIANIESAKIQTVQSVQKICACFA